MSGDLTNRGAQDRPRISIGEEHEVRCWTEEFGVTKERFAKAVDQVGSGAEAVGIYLGKAV